MANGKNIVLTLNRKKISINQIDSDSEVMFEYTKRKLGYSDILSTYLYITLLPFP